jgi:hypothetical protein
VVAFCNLPSSKEMKDKLIASMAAYDKPKIHGQKKAAAKKKPTPIENTASNLRSPLPPSIPTKITMGGKGCCCIC